MSQNCPRFRGVRAPGLLLFGLLLACMSLLPACKPDKEPDYPYGKAPAKPVAQKQDVAAPLEEADAGRQAPEADAGAAKEPDAGAAKAPDAGAAKQGDTAAAPDAAVVAGSDDAQARFYALVGLRLVGRTDDGVHRWLFKPTGFFEHELYGNDRVTTRRTGTYKLADGTLSITYKETKRQPASQEGISAGESTQDGSAALPVTTAGTMKLRIGEVEVAVDLDD